MAGPFFGVRRRSGAYSFLARCYPILGACVWRALEAAAHTRGACHAARLRATGGAGLSGWCGLRREQLAAGAGDGVADVLAPQLAEGVECGA